MKRREFIKTTGAVVAGAVILPNYSLPKSNTKKVVIIGAGISGPVRSTLTFSGLA